MATDDPHEQLNCRTVRRRTEDHGGASRRRRSRRRWRRKGRGVLRKLCRGLTTDDCQRGSGGKHAAAEDAQVEERRRGLEEKEEDLSFLARDSREWM